MTIDELYSEMQKAITILIMAHEAPDGDAIGSCLAMGLMLKNMGKKPDILMKDFPANFDFLPGKELIKEETQVEKYDLAICLDCPNLLRVNKDFQKYFENAKVKAEIDHHTKNEMFGDYNIANHASPATCQILATSFDYLNIDMTKDIATCLLTGIITDTGGFKNTGITTETFDFASECLEKGINIPYVFKQAMFTTTRTKFEAEKLTMSRMEFYNDGKIAFTYLTKEDKEKIGLKVGEQDGIVDIGKGIEGVEVSIFLYEKDNGFKASLRSNEYVNVSEVCFKFGGGGHIKAAGATLNMSFEEAKDAIIKEVAKNLK